VQFGAGAAERAGQARKFLALGPKNFGKATADRDVAAFARDVFENVEEILARRSEINQAAHSGAGLGQLRGLCRQRGGEVVVGKMAAGGDGGIHGLA